MLEILGLSWPVKHSIIVVSQEKKWPGSCQLAAEAEQADQEPLPVSGGETTAIWAKHVFKPSPSHHHFDRWYCYHSQENGWCKGILFTTLYGDSP